MLESSVATEMATTNLLLARNGSTRSKRGRSPVRHFLSNAAHRLLGLLDADVTLLNPVFGMSAVSFRPNGDRQWVSYKQNFSDEYRLCWTKIFLAWRGLPISEPALKVVAIGAPSAMVDALITLDGPRDTIPFTTTMIMRRYFELKKAGHLDELSLLEAEQLAAGLVQNTVKYAPEAAGVGGPIDVATLSKDGFRWIAESRMLRHWLRRLRPALQMHLQMTVALNLSTASNVCVAHFAIRYSPSKAKPILGWCSRYLGTIAK